jgi:hypothetical protein
MKPILTTLFLLVMGVSANLHAEAIDPSAPTPNKKVEATKRDVFSTRVLFEKDGKELGSFTAYGSIDAEGRYLSCTGSIALSDSGLWRISIQADLKAQEYSDVAVEVEDMKLLRKLADGDVTPVRIFSTQLQSKGVGRYSFGEVQGVTLRVEITKAEQAGSSNGG